MVRSVLFDVDGTLLDTNEYIYQAFEHTLNTYGAPTSRETMKVHMGKLLHHMYEIFAPSHNAESLAQTHREFQEKNTYLATVFPHVIETLEKLRASNIKIAAVTTRSRESCIATLDHTGLHQLLDVVVTGDDVQKHKPDPEPLNKALAALGARASEAFMVGDTSIDVFAGKNAGVKTIAVTYGFHAETVANSNPDHVVASIREILPLVLG